MHEIKVFSPASVANLSCGYDILGACLDGIGDEIIVRKTKKKRYFNK
jgi:homoserine kinase